MIPSLGADLLGGMPLGNQPEHFELPRGEIFDLPAQLRIGRPATVAALLELQEAQRLPLQFVTQAGVVDAQRIDSSAKGVQLDGGDRHFALLSPVRAPNVQGLNVM